MSLKFSGFKVLVSMITYKSKASMEVFSTPSDQCPVVCFHMREQKVTKQIMTLHRMKLPWVNLVYYVIPFP